MVSGFGALGFLSFSRVCPLGDASKKSPAIVIAGLFFTCTSIATSEGEVEAKCGGEEHRHLPARQRIVRAVVPASASSSDPRGSQRFDELPLRVSDRNIGKRSRARRRAYPEDIRDTNAVHANSARVRTRPSPGHERKEVVGHVVSKSSRNWRYRKETATRRRG